MKIRRIERKGLVLPVVVVMAIVLAILGAGMLQIAWGTRLFAAMTTADMGARSAADAGIGHALYGMNRAIPFEGGAIDMTLWPSPLPLTVNPIHASTTQNFTYDIVPNADYWEIISTGLAGRGPKTVHAVSKRSSYWFGVGVKESFNLRSGGIFATYPPGSPFDGMIRTNSIGHWDINLQAGTSVPGDVVIGQGGDVPYTLHMPSGTAQVGGDTYPANDILDFPPAELSPLVSEPWPNAPPLTFVTTAAINPDGTPILDALGNPVMISQATLLTGAYRFNGDLDIPKIDGTAWTELRILGEVFIHVTHDMRLGNGCKLIVGDGEPTIPDRLELYLGQSTLDAGLSSLVAVNGSAVLTMPQSSGVLPNSLDLKIYGLPSCTTTSKNSPAITLHNSGEFWGVIYAPDAPLSIHNSGSMYGGFIGYSLDIDNSGAFYYDSRLADAEQEGPSYFEIIRWWEE